MKFVRLIAMAICGICVFNSCSSVEEFNKPASFWYERILYAVANDNLEQADNYFNALQSEHIASPLIGEALILLTNAHIERNEHLLAGFFAGEYKTRFSNTNNIDYISFLEMKVNYYAFGNYSKDQGFINDNINDISHFVALNKNNNYLPYINHILTSFKLSRLEMNNEIIRIYNIKDKDLAKEKYEQYNKDLGVGDIEFVPSHIPWYVRIFSW